jgi:hypothetical protein
MTPTSHLWPATIKVWAQIALTEIEDSLSEETMAIGHREVRPFCAFRACNFPSISSVASPVPKEHTGMATMLKHLDSYAAPSMKMMPGTLSISPAM